MGVEDHRRHDLGLVNPTEDDRGRVYSVGVQDHRRNDLGLVNPTDDDRGRV